MKLLIGLIVPVILSAQMLAGIVGDKHQSGGGGGITIGTVQSSGNFFSVASSSYSVTVAATAHPALWVAVWIDGNTVTGCSYNSVAMTQLSSTVNDVVSYRLATFVLVNPATGANTLACTFGGTVSSIGGVIQAIPLYGVNQTGTVGNSWRTPPTPTNDGGGGTVTASITATTVSGDLVIDAVEEFNQTLGSPGAGQTSQFVTSSDGFGNVEGRGISTKTATTTSTTMTWTFTSTFWQQHAVAFIPG